MLYCRPKFITSHINELCSVFFCDRTTCWGGRGELKHSWCSLETCAFQEHLVPLLILYSQYQSNITCTLVPPFSFPLTYFTKFVTKSCTLPLLGQWKTHRMAHPSMTIASVCPVARADCSTWSLFYSIDLDLAIRKSLIISSNIV